MFYSCYILSKFQIHDFAPNPNFPLSDSEGTVELFPAGGEKRTVEVPSETSGRYWIIGTFNGVDGLDGIDISNTIVENFNNDELCGYFRNASFLQPVFFMLFRIQSK